MRDHSSRNYNKKTVTRYRTKSMHRSSVRTTTQKYKVSELPHKIFKPYEARG